MANPSETRFTPTLTPAHESAIRAAVEVIEKRWQASGSRPDDWRAATSRLLNDVFALARLGQAALEKDPAAPHAPEPEPVPEPAAELPTPQNEPAA